MANPQQPELGRSRKTPAQNPDSAAALVETRGPLPDEGPAGPVPPENQPGHHPAQEQDKPDLDAFAERLGISGDGSGEARATDAGSGLQARTPGGRPQKAVVIGGFMVLVVLMLRTRRRRARRRR